MIELPFFKFQPAKWLTGTVRFCSLKAQGLFVNLCAHYWERKCKMDLSYVLMTFPDTDSLLNELEEDGIISFDKSNKIHIKFLDEQWLKFNQNQQKESKDQPSSRVRTHLKAEAEAEAEKNKRRRKLRRNNKQPIKRGQFSTFWNIYPKKASKGQALTAWEKLCKKPPKDRPTWQEIRIAIIRQTDSNQWQDKQYIPNPSTWLNQSRWLDDPEQMKGRSSTPTRQNTKGSRLGKPGTKKYRKPDMEI